MASIDEIYSLLFDKLSEALAAQRDLHASAFGKDPDAAKEITTQAAINRERIECWQELVQDLRTEMIESGIFVNEQRIYQRHYPTVHKTDDYTKTSSERPTSVCILGQHSDIRYWKEVPLLTCRLLYEKHPEKFEGIENEPTLHGRERPYITKNSTLLRNPGRINGTPYYIETNLSKGDCKKLAILFLEYFGYEVSDLQISKSPDNAGVTMDLNTNNASVEYDGQVKIGVRARTIFSQLFAEGKLSYDELSRLCRLDYSRQTLGLYLPALKLIPPGKHASSARKDQNGNNRYYKDVYNAGSDRYLLCSQWFKQQYSKLEKYYENFN